MAYFEQPVPSKLAVVLGNEWIGIKPDAMGAVDAVVYVPSKQALDVTTAAHTIVFDAISRAGWCDQAEINHSQRQCFMKELV